RNVGSCARSSITGPSSRICSCKFGVRAGTPGVKEKFADSPLSRFTPKSVGVLRDRRIGLPEVGNERIKLIRNALLGRGGRALRKIPLAMTGARRSDVVLLGRQPVA